MWFVILLACVLSACAINSARHSVEQSTRTLSLLETRRGNCNDLLLDRVNAHGERYVEKCSILAVRSYCTQEDDACIDDAIKSCRMSLRISVKGLIDACTWRDMSLDDFMSQYHDDLQFGLDPLISEMN